MDEVKNKFLAKTNVKNENDALRNCISASFKRNKIYRNGWNSTSQLQKYELHSSLKVELQRLAEPYISDTVSEDEHETNIQIIADNISKKHGAILRNGRFNIGTSQKALNLYLKFLWCLGRLSAEPIHCPVDRVILGKVAVYGAWTKLDDIHTYQTWISSIRITANIQTLAIWELEQYNIMVLSY